MCYIGYSVRSPTTKRCSTFQCSRLRDPDSIDSARCCGVWNRGSGVPDKRSGAQDRKSGVLDRRSDEFTAEFCLLSLDSGLLVLDCVHLGTGVWGLGSGVRFFDFSLHRRFNNILSFSSIHLTFFRYWQYCTTASSCKSNVL